ncbi:hypothetical protein [Asanoa iriomotensis]|uniref:Fe2OG dioxygenase domain-containing protein n=1 Tax=Asanoa iriomotensis TaxID=234613 RepID=A0ABQ4C693_9ACTN|nr:hypothetical protein [Asanoa iriomotensis]GIF57805.1 hypothetical protein Air01nite_39000 [Asanoa iriomotensis]
MELLSRETRARVASALESSLESSQGVRALNTAINVQHAFSAEVTKVLVAGLFTRGDDLVSAYGGVVADDVTKEVVVPDAERKIPLLHTLSRELTDCFAASFGASDATTEVQVRLYDNGVLGHPRHADDVELVTVASHPPHKITTVSSSMPIRLPTGVEFLMHLDDGDVVQDTPGSLAIFGPLIQHTTPRQPISGRVVWLTGLTVLRYFEGDA